MDTNALTTIGKINGAAAFSLLGNAIAIDTANTPCLLWDSKTAYTFQTTAQSLEILSASASDASAGVGARTVLVESLDTNLAEVSTIVTMNGTTPVALPGTHLHVNRMTVLTSGSSNSNVGAITLRVAAAGATQGYIAAAVGVQRAFKFTVPAGKVVIVDNFYGNAANAGGNSIIATTSFIVRSPNGTLLNSVTNSFSSQTGPFSVSLPTGFSITEGLTFMSTVSAVSQSGASIALNATGRIYTLEKM